MSLMMCNLADGSSISGSDASGNINTYLNKMGFTNVSRKNTFKISPIENIGGNLYIGKKTIQVGANKKSVKGYKDVYGIFLGGFDTENNYKKLLANFDKEEVSSFYENIANDIIEYINISRPSTTNDYCYWVTGYSIAGGIAGEEASRLAEEAEVYCYTFGATNTNMTGSGAYACIKNVINEDDLYPKIYNVENGFYRNGMLYNDSIYDNLKREYSDLVGNFRNYKISAKRTNTIKQKIQQVRNIVTRTDWITTWITNLSSYLKRYTYIYEIFDDFLHPFQSYDSTQLKNILNDNSVGVEKAHEIKSYYVLSKSLNGFDLNNKDVGWTEYDESLGSEEYVDELTKEDEEYQERLNLLLNAIETVGRAYLDNVYTYHGASRYSYTGEDSIENQIAKKIPNQNSDEFDVEDVIFNEKKKMKTSTINAYEKWNERKEQVYEKIYEQVKNNVVSSDEELTDEKEEIINNLSKQTIKTVYSQMKAADNNPTALHHLDILDEYATRNKKYIRYNYDDTINLGLANKESYVGDDCSSFAAAVYWYYLNNISKSKDKTKIDLWTTGSSQFVSTRYSHHILSVLLENGFTIYQWDETEHIDDDYNIKIKNGFKLKPGDLLYRAPQNGKVAHVEFYLGEGHSFGWGEIHSNYDNNDKSKHFEIIRDLDIYNIGKTRKASQVSSGETYRIEGNYGAGIYNTIKAYDANCRYDYVIRLEKQITEQEEANE